MVSTVPHLEYHAQLWDSQYLKDATDSYQPGGELEQLICEGERAALAHPGGETVLEGI